MFLRIVFKDGCPFIEWEVRGGVITKTVDAVPGLVSWVGKDLNCSDTVLFKNQPDFTIVYADGENQHLPVDHVMRVPEQGDEFTAQLVWKMGPGDEERLSDFIGKIAGGKEAGAAGTAPAGTQGDATKE